jgi:transposase
VKAERAEWLERLPFLDPQHLVFVDETAVATWLGRNYGYSPRGQDAILTRDPYPQRMSIVGAIGLDGVRTAVAIPGGFDGDAFLAFVEQELVPTLRPYDIVIMDNLRVHKVAGVRDAIEAAGAFLLYQPRYSPDLNPIECFWEWAKSRLRNVVARTTELVVEVFGRAMDEVPKQHIAGWFRHCGYGSEVRST